MALVRAAFVPCLAIVLAGCAVADEPSASPADGDFAALAASVLEDARADGASAAQIRIIEESLDSGEVSFEAVQGAVHATFACFDAAGVRYEELAPAVTNGILFPSYTFEGEDNSAIADECIQANSNFVEMLYMRQPVAVEAANDAFEAGMPVLIDCLRRLGYEIDDDVTADELKAMLVMQEDDIGTPKEQEAIDRFRCVGEAGIDGW